MGLGVEQQLVATVLRRGGADCFYKQQRHSCFARHSPSAIAVLPSPLPVPPLQGCFRHLRTMFQELEEIRPFELLKSQGDRVNYLMTKQAKIVAMTCTHAALKRK